MIVFENAGKAYRNRKGAISWVLRDFHATFEPHVNTGILVPPSQGKTTFINLAAGNETPSEGRVFRRGKVSWPFTANVTSNKLSGKQNIRFLTDIYGRSFTDVYEFVKEFADLGRHLDGSLRNYNGEMRSRLCISTLLGMGFDFILVDNVMDGGDVSFRRKCAKFLDDNRDHLTFLIATEKPQLVTKYCQSAGVLNEGKLTFFDRVDDAIEEFNRVNPALV